MRDRLGWAVLGRVGGTWDVQKSLPSLHGAEGILPC